ncbi:MAG: hypothetical protein A3G35_19285 [candidate division NC10 bacterium RIFCSPLOWO2_12_FULL_66_18]|nr:MAG: hypothetical protein A3H39_07320 [candidate division NC10 bacterium RIFCSPLOWO2_02_FULL_66_22]OGB99873.1 MAG: hypothetical protein A3G35_19285 [candidate division NC10 bacterium RIFCSPLOWO2_12_FULL_66_18]
MKSIEVQNLSKVFDNPLSGRLVVLDGISFTVEFGGFLSILGPSGSGKSLLLQIIAGLERPTEGTIRLGHPGAEPAAAGPAHANGSAHRNGSRIGFVFQAPRLLPWKRAGENIRYVLTGRSLGRSEEDRIIDWVLGITGLLPYKGYYPHQLSGGMQQRLAIARALAYDADVILMDEPFSNLDEITACNLREEVARIWAETKKTILFVTHDICEACFLGSEIILLTPKPTRIYERFAIDLPRPRVYGSEELFEKERQVLRTFEQSVAAHTARPVAR